MEEFLTVGLWGGEGGDRWSFVVNKGGIIGMEIVHANGIASITFKCGDEYGVLQHSRKFGGTGAGWKTDKVRTYIYWYYSVTLIMHYFL